MRRREILAGCVSVVAAAPSALATGGTRRPHVGILVPYPSSDREEVGHVNAFKTELRQLGWSEDVNLEISERWSGNDLGNIARHARDLVTSDPTVVLIRSTGATSALLRETRTIPVVFVVVSDPVGDGFVASMAHPGGNATGFTNVEASLAGKWLELLLAVAPKTRSVLLVYGPSAAAGGGAYYHRLVEAAAVSRGITVRPCPIAQEGDVDAALDNVSETLPGILVLPDLVTTGLRKTLVAAAARRRVPAIYPFRSFVDEGGLLSYGVEVEDLYRRAARYVDRVLRGASPADLPVQAPVKFALTVHARTAQSLELGIPQSLLALADEVIE